MKTYDDDDVGERLSVLILGAGSSLFSALRWSSIFRNAVLVPRNLTLEWLNGLGLSRTSSYVVVDFRSPAPSECDMLSVTATQKSLVNAYELLAQDLGYFKLVRLSSGSVYGAKDSGFFPTEISPLNPSTAYAYLHASMEQCVLNVFGGTVVRLPNILLSRPREHHFISKILSLGEADKLYLSDDGTTVRNFIEEGKVAHFLSELLYCLANNIDVPRVFNIRGGDVMSTLELVERINPTALDRVIPIFGAPLEPFRVLESIYWMGLCDRD